MTSLIWKVSTTLSSGSTRLTDMRRTMWTSCWLVTSPIWPPSELSLLIKPRYAVFYNITHSSCPNRVMSLCTYRNLLIHWALSSSKLPPRIPPTLRRHSWWWPLKSRCATSLFLKETTLPTSTCKDSLWAASQAAAAKRLDQLVIDL